MGPPPHLGGYGVGIEGESDDADDYDLKCELMEKRIYFYLS